MDSDYQHSNFKATEANDSLAPTELQYLRIVSSKCSHLRYLSVRMYNEQCMNLLCQAVSKHRRFEVLRILTSQDFAVDGSALVDAICHNQPNLRVLALFNSCQYNSDWVLEPGTLGKIARSFPYLEVLYIDTPQFSTVSSAEVLSLLNNCRQLVVFGLACWTFKIDEVFGSPNLCTPLVIHTLCLPWCGVVNGNCEDIAKACPKLKELDVGMSAIDDVAVAIIARFLDLQTLDVYRFVLFIPDVCSICLKRSWRNWERFFSRQHFFLLRTSISIVSLVLPWGSWNLAWRPFFWLLDSEHDVTGDWRLQMTVCRQSLFAVMCSQPSVYSRHGRQSLAISHQSLILIHQIISHSSVLSLWSVIDQSPVIRMHENGSSPPNHQHCCWLCLWTFIITHSTVFSTVLGLPLKSPMHRGEFGN